MGQGLLDRYRTVRRRTERLAAPLSPEDQVVQSMPDVSPTKWHRAHTTWFFDEFVLGGLSGELGHPEYRFLFNSYYEAVGARHPRPERGLVTRPSVSEVAEYRGCVDDAIERLFARGFDDPAAARVIELGTHHEEQHQELLLMDIKHVLSMNPAVCPAYVEMTPARVDDPGPVGWVGFEGGRAVVGREWAAAGQGGFAFDNEGPVHEVLLYDFQLADRLVTAGEWLEFIDDGGYERPELWLSDGWVRLCTEAWNAPLYWQADPDLPEGWCIHTLTGLRDVDPHEPVVHVSYYEADAFATWSGARLPTEFEWERAARDVSVDGVFMDLGDPEFPFHPRSAGPPSGQLRQLFGDCWEWTSSAYQPYPGFRPAAGAIGEYNGKFMSGQQVLRGGGALTPPGHVRASYRNFFHPHTRWHAGGVRLARNGAV